MRLLAALVGSAVLCPAISYATAYRPVLDPLPLQSTLKALCPRLREQIDYRATAGGGGFGSCTHSPQIPFVWWSPPFPYRSIALEHGEWPGADVVRLLGKSLLSATELKIHYGPGALLIYQDSAGAILREAYALICEAFIAGRDDDYDWPGEQIELAEYKKIVRFEPNVTFVFEGTPEAQIELDTDSLRMVVVFKAKWRSVQIDQISVAAIDELIKRAVSGHPDR